MSNTQQSQILNKLKTVSKGAWKRARTKEAKPRGGGGLPPNLKNVVAACQTYRLATTNNASKDPYFQLGVIIKDPQELEGRKATIMWFINESEWATVEENLEQLSNDLQLMGLDMPEDVGDVVDLLADLCERGVHILLNTGGPKKSGKSPSIFIQGLADEWPDEPQDGAGEATGRDANKNQKGGKGGKPADEESAEETEETEETTEEVEEVAEETTEDEAPWEPAKGEQYNYLPPKSKTPILVTVTAVDKKKKTFDLKGGKPPKVFKAIKWWKDKEETEASVEGA